MGTKRVTPLTRIVFSFEETAVMAFLFLVLRTCCEGLRRGTGFDLLVPLDAAEPPCRKEGSSTASQSVEAVLSFLCARGNADKTGSFLIGDKEWDGKSELKSCCLRSSRALSITGVVGQK